MKDTKPSSTARFVANGVWWVSNHSTLNKEVPTVMKELNLKMVQEINKGPLAVNHFWGHTLLKIKSGIMQKAAMPGFYLHFVLRKRCIEEHVQKAIHNGTEQIIILGAGYDTLSLQIAEKYPELTIIEIDHPATQEVKKKAIKSTHGNLHLLPIDFTKSSLSEGLQSVNYFSREKKSTFIAEGLTMYLSEVEVKETLKSIRENSTKGSQFIFTYMEERSLGNHQFKNASWITSLWLKLKNENFTWGLNETALSQFLLDSQFHLTESKDHNNLREDFLSSLNQNSPLAIGENIAIAEVF